MRSPRPCHGRWLPRTTTQATKLNLLIAALLSAGARPATATVVALGGSLYISKVSQNGVEWASGQMLGHATINAVEDLEYCSAWGAFVAIGQVRNSSNNANRAHVWTSVDGVAWTNVPLPALPDSAYNTNSLACGTTTAGGEMAVMVGRASGNWIVRTSDDGGESWTIRRNDVSGGSNHQSCTMAGGGKFVSVAFSGSFIGIHSEDGVTWLDATHEGSLPAAYNDHPHSCTYANGRFWAVARCQIQSQGWIISSSVDGAVWTSRRHDKFECSYSGCGQMKRLTHTGTRLVATDGGSGGNVASRGAYSDDDGVTWTVFHSPMYTGSSILHVEGLYIQAGGLQDGTPPGVWTSTELGITVPWEERTTFPGPSCCSLAYLMAWDGQSLTTSTQSPTMVPTAPTASPTPAPLHEADEASVGTANGIDVLLSSRTGGSVFANGRDVVGELAWLRDEVTGLRSELAAMSTAFTRALALLCANDAAFC